MLTLTPLSFEHPLLLSLLGLVPIWIFWRRRSAGLTPHQTLGYYHPALAALNLRARRRNPLPVLLLEALGLSLALLALAGPQLRNPTPEAPIIGRDFAFVLDVSRSMSIRDQRSESGQPMSRIEVLKASLGEFVSSREADRISLLVLGQGAAVLSPPTSDLAHIQRQILRLDAGLLASASAVGDGLALALQYVRQRQLPPAVLYIGDGDLSNAGDVTPAEALAVALADGITVHALQLGPDAPEPETLIGLDAAIPQPRLRDITAQTGGSFHFGVDEPAIRGYFEALHRLTPTRQGPPPPPVDTSQALWLLLAALLCLGLSWRWRSA